ncbi:MAG: glycosyltransferase, partial [Deltaproteobacteria bacterium]|nr:glycosyltransferase [Deltaproteobacteria bacterium]
AWYMEEIAARIRELGLEKSVRTFFRPFTTDEIVLFHSASDMVVLPYKDITQSAALFTAMAFGKAIIATAVGGFTETLKDGKTALLVNYDDSGGLASAILRLARSPEEMTALGSGALEELKMNYSWDRIAQMTMEYYMSVSTAHGS